MCIRLAQEDLVETFVKVYDRSCKISKSRTEISSRNCSCFIRRSQQKLERSSDDIIPWFDVEISCEETRRVTFEERKRVPLKVFFFFFLFFWNYGLLSEPFAIRHAAQYPNRVYTGDSTAAAMGTRRNVVGGFYER